MARKCKEIATRVATHGAFVATEGFRNAIYDGDNDVTVLFVDVKGDILNEIK